MVDIFIDIKHNYEINKYLETKFYIKYKIV